MYIITIPRRRLRWIGAAIAAAAIIGVVLGTGESSIAERNDTAPVSAKVTDLVRTNLRPIYSADTKEKVIALTFDISWGNKMPPKVLDVLKQENLKATFFLSGPWSKNHVDVVTRIRDDGHEIESHGQRHVDLNTLGRQGAAKNISDAHAILHEITGKTARYIRPPNGAFNKESVQAARDLNYETVIWSVDSLDWKNPGVQTIIDRTTKLVHPGAIILMHASDSCKQTDLALPTVIKTLRAQGYRFVLLDELVRQYGVDENGFIHSRIPR
jgi:polysaccharide deacetylase family sporulation protein PdaB